MAQWNRRRPIPVTNGFRACRPMTQRTASSTSGPSRGRRWRTALTDLLSVCSLDGLRYAFRQKFSMSRRFGR